MYIYPVFESTFKFKFDFLTFSVRERIPCCFVLHQFSCFKILIKNGVKRARQGSPPPPPTTLSTSTCLSAGLSLLNTTRGQYVLRSTILFSMKRTSKILVPGTSGYSTWNMNCMNLITHHTEIVCFLRYFSFLIQIPGRC